MYLFVLNYYLYPYFYLVQFIAGDSYTSLTNNETNLNVIDFDSYNSSNENEMQCCHVKISTCCVVVWALIFFTRRHYYILLHPDVSALSCHHNHLYIAILTAPSLSILVYP
jgi:hypothetical protein